MMSTTLNKLEYLDETKGQIKTALNQFEAGITDETTFRDYTNKIEGIYNNWPKVTGSGTEITLNNTKAAKMVMDIKGNSMQGDNPSPESPQPIYSAGDNGSITEKIINKNYVKIQALEIYEISSGLPTNKLSGITINSFNSNNVDMTITVNSYRIALTNLMQLKPNTEYTLSYSRDNISQGTSPQFRRYVYAYDNNEYIRLNGITSGDTGNQNVTFTTTESGMIALAWGFGNASSGSNSIINNVMIEEGSTVTSFVKHQEQNISIPCQQPMRSIGNVRDEFVKVSGVWYERHNIKEMLLNVNSSWSKSTTDTMDRFLLDLSNDFNKIKSGACLCNYFKFRGDSQNNIGEFRNNAGNQLIFNYSEYGTTTLEQFKTWLENNNVYVDCVALTPTDLPCTEAQIAVLEGLQQVVSYDTQTNINTTDTTPAYVEASALEKGGN